MSAQSYYLYTWVLMGALALLVFVLTLVGYVISIVLGHRGDKKDKKDKKATLLGMDQIAQIAWNPTSSAEDVIVALHSFLGQYGKITQEDVAGDGKQKKLDLIGAIAKHKQISKEFVVDFQKQLLDRNRDHIKEITQVLDRVQKEKG